MTTEEFVMQKEDVIGTPELVEESESKVLYPDTDTTVFSFMGRAMKLRALPIAYARRIKAELKPFDRIFAENAKRAQSGDPVEAVDMDDTTVDALIGCAEVICKFYKVNLAREEIEEGSTVGELLDLAQAQLEVNGKSDFLLTSLRLITKVSGLAGEASELVNDADLAQMVRDEMRKDLPRSS